MPRSEIAERAAFDRIRYAQVWEDADVLLAGLRVRSGDTVASIASAGDNVLALLTADPARVVALDLSEVQLHCLRLRMAAYRNLSHPELLELIGSRASTRREALLDRAAAELSTDAHAFWQTQKAAVIRHGLGGVGKFESYFRLFRRRILPLVHSRRRVRALLAPKTPEARESFFAERWNTWRWRLLIRLFFSRGVMGRLGRDPAFFDHAIGDLGQQVADKTRQALTEQDPSQNPYLHWILTGRHGDALPLALREEHFETIRGRLDRVELHRLSLEDFCAGGEAADAFNLSDVFEYMSEQHFAAAYGRLLDAARPGARLLHWNMMVPRGIPASCSARARRAEALEASLKPLDKAFFYSDLVVAERRG